MCTQKDGFEFSISHSNLPFFRAGFTNILLFIFTILAILINQFLNDMALSNFWKILFFPVFIFIVLFFYNKSICKIKKNEHQLKLIRPLSVTNINMSSVKHVNIYGIPTSITFIFLIKQNNKILPIFYYFIGVPNYIASYEETKQRLIKICNNE